MGATLWWTNSLLLKMAIEIVDFPIKHGGSFHCYVSSPEATCKKNMCYHIVILFSCVALHMSPQTAAECVALPTLCGGPYHSVPFKSTSEGHHGHKEMGKWKVLRMCPPVVKRGHGKYPIYKWCSHKNSSLYGIFHCYLWLPEGRNQKICWSFRVMVISGHWRSFMVMSTIHVFFPELWRLMVQ